MDYEKLLKEAESAGTAKHLAPQMVRLKKGDTVVGAYLGRDEIESKDAKMPNYFMYRFECTQGPVRFKLSGSYDQGQGSQLKIGGVYAIRYLDMVDLGNKKQFKELDTIIITEPGDDERPDDDSDEEGEE